ncbi:MAG: hypothetical protein DLM72_05710 [Candidatus Nitrosopolaris wilkensis]|nr:MAG: hypothetical protein DLM72_05710 [Candidatus Nitrosopolaris wilkensis]
MLTRMARQWSSVEEARKSRVIVRRNLKHGGEISSKRVLQVTDYDELVYKLTLKYLQKGYDISNNTIPHVKNT